MDTKEIVFTAEESRIILTLAMLRHGDMTTHDAVRTAVTDYATLRLTLEAGISFPRDSEGTLTYEASTGALRLRCPAWWGGPVYGPPQRTPPTE